MNYWEFRRQFNEGHKFPDNDPPINSRTMYELFVAHSGNIVSATLGYASSKYDLEIAFSTEKFSPELIARAAIERRSYVKNSSSPNLS